MSDTTTIIVDEVSATEVITVVSGTPGPPIIALTQAAYEALDPPDADTLYLITDAAGMVTGSMHLTGSLELDGALDHDGSAVGFYGTLPVARPSSVGPKAVLEALGLGTSLVLDSPHATNSGTIEGTSTDTSVTPAGLAYANLYRGRGVNARIDNYTVRLADAEKLITFTAVSPLTLTVPTNAAETVPIGVHVDVARLGAGAVTVAAAVGVTVVGTPGLKLRAQYSKAQLTMIAVDNWLLSGDLSA